MLESAAPTYSSPPHPNQLAKEGGGLSGDVALRAANIVAKRVYDKAISSTGKPRGQLSDRAVREAVARTVAGVRRGTVVITEQARKPRPQPGKRKKARDAAISEAVKGAVSQVLAEAASRPRAPKRPLTEMSGDELAAHLEDAFSAAMKAPVDTGARPVAESGEASLPSRPLHELDVESFEDHCLTALAQGGAELRSPFWAGSGAPRSPFWRTP